MVGCFSTWMLDIHRLGSSSLPHLARRTSLISHLARFAAFALGHWIA
jgi:fluoride ion exporter CrcB/FEX